MSSERFGFGHDKEFGLRLGEPTPEGFVVDLFGERCEAETVGLLACWAIALDDH
jgi:hypothetical protein